ncbi:nuclear transport factor 2 family protein [Microbacterium sp. ARD32]|uniref:nuclear transport factor 2 family protein n=1 Tax=Microbacterium sp. ARD32 TaxID=2962577 RepID=UPI0028814016|nr:nuclear transport factor 2 family protein [Microbacterium sp. ARD32]MDT0158041.1 nuclear transport factor 2 family protein [Microbacterium sp. ARD32]
MMSGASDDTADRSAIFDLVRRERFARDQRRFDVMRDCFHDNAWVRTTWYDGIGGQAYVDSTRELLGDVNAQTYSGKHWVLPALARVNGDRALVESPAKIFSRYDDIGGIPADIHSYCRFFSRVVRQHGTWRLLTFHVLFEWDELRPVVPGQVPQLDTDLLGSIRPSYRYLGYAQTLRGVDVNDRLLGDDRWADLVAFHRGEDEWLGGAGAIDQPR